MKANEMQVGGTHYKTSYEHWDFVINTGQSYLEGCCTKYVARWRKKEGIEDLKKALHYLDKLREQPIPFFRWWFMRCNVRKRCWLEINKFVGANGLDWMETSIISNVTCWRSNRNLLRARGLLQELIADAISKGVGIPVPLTEENHYADRTMDQPRQRPPNCIWPKCNPADQTEGKCCGWVEG